MQGGEKSGQLAQGRRGFSRTVLRHIRKHEKLLFVAASGMGWLIDFATFNIAIYLFHAQPFAANYLSSVAGSVFAFSVYCLYAAGAGRPPRPGQIAVYVCFQVASITFYSLCVGWLAAMPWIAAWREGPLITKIIVTPFNFVTNYVATRTVLKFLKPRGILQ